MTTTIGPYSPDLSLQAGVGKHLTTENTVVTEQQAEAQTGWQQSPVTPVVKMFSVIAVEEEPGSPATARWASPSSRPCARSSRCRRR